MVFQTTLAAYNIRKSRSERQVVWQGCGVRRGVWGLNRWAHTHQSAEVLQGWVCKTWCRISEGVIQGSTLDHLEDLLDMLLRVILLDNLLLDWYFLDNMMHHVCFLDPLIITAARGTVFPRNYVTLPYMEFCPNPCTYKNGITCNPRSYM